MTEFFTDVPERIGFGGLDSDDPLTFKVYQPDRQVLGSRMEDQLRIAVCLWHSFNWPGSDVFGVGTFDRPWLAPGTDPMEAARTKLDAAFEFVDKLGVPFFTFHDRDVSPEGASFAETRSMLEAVVGEIEGHMQRTGARLLWGTANLFSHPRYAAGAATNPDPEVFAYAAAQVKLMLETTNRLRGENYVLWGGREGYETLLNTDLEREEEQLARFLTLVAEHKHRIGFAGTLLLEPKPQEPTKHQYDYDSATVDSFLVRHDLADEYRVNIEANHATLAGHSFQHEVAVALSRGIFGSIDMNRGDPQNGWDTDQFPNSVDDLALALYEILRGGGFTSGGFNFDAKLRRQSMDRTDLFHAHIGGIDTLARALLVAADLVEAGDARRGDEIAATPAGRTGSVPRCSVAGSRSPRSRRAWSATESSRVRAPAARSGSRTSSTAGSGRSIGAADAVALSPRARRLDDRDEGHPGRRGGARPGHRQRGATTTTSRGRSGASRTRSCGGTPPRTRPSVKRSPPPASVPATSAAVGLSGQMHGAVLLDAADERCAPRSCGTTSGPRPMRRDPRPGRRRAPDRDHRQRRAHRVHCSQAALGARATSPDAGIASRTSCCRRTSSGIA